MMVITITTMMVMLVMVMMVKMDFLFSFSLHRCRKNHAALYQGLSARTLSRLIVTGDNFFVVGKLIIIMRSQILMFIQPNPLIPGLHVRIDKKKPII